MINIVFLSTAHIHTKGFMEAIAKRTDCRVPGIWDEVADRGKRYAQQFGGEFIADL